MKQKLLSTLLFLLCILFFTGVTQAGTISMPIDIGELNQISDQSFENLINLIGGGGASDTLDVGDRLRGIFNITTHYDHLGNQTNYAAGSVTTWNREITGLFDITVASKSNPSATNYNWTFGPTASFASSWGTGAMLVVFSDAASDFAANAGSVAAAEATATNGAHYWTMGYSGGGGAPTGGEGWYAFGGSDKPSELGPVVSAGNYNAGLTLLTQGVGPELQASQNSPVPGLGAFLVDLNIGGTFVNNQQTGTTYYDVQDTMDGFFTPIPEPGSISLIGIGLLGLAAGMRRRLKKKQG